MIDPIATMTFADMQSTIVYGLSLGRVDGVFESSGGGMDMDGVSDCVGENIGW